MAGDRRASIPENVALSAYGAVGALLGAALLAVLSATGQVRLHRASAPAPASASTASPDAGTSCPIKTSSPMCDACMKERCLMPCADCAEDPDCIQLFLCVLDCREPACSRACSDRYPHATQVLEAFAGEQGCMRKCRDACR